MKNPKMQTLTTTIKGEYLRAIINGGQTIEHREVKPYWHAKLAKYETPFWLRLINGMSAEAPEVTIEVVKVRKDSRPFDGHPKGVYCLHLGKIKSNSKKNLRNLIK